MAKKNPAFDSLKRHPAHMGKPPMHKGKPMPKKKMPVSTGSIANKEDEPASQEEPGE